MTATPPSTTTPVLALALWVLLTAASPAESAEWSVTELHLQYGSLAAPTFAGGGSSPTRIVTLQHASGWSHGDVFFFVDVIDDRNADGFNDRDLYAELYANLSLGAVTGTSVGAGPLSDVGLLAGCNWGADADVTKYLPGVRLAFSAPGFRFLNLDLTAYLDDSGGLSAGGAPAETDSYMIDLNWALPFSVGRHRFSLEGHVEYIGDRRDELGGTVHAWLLGQPQLRYDLGALLLHRPDTVYVGVEWQIWINKLGDADTDENAVQALAVWRF